MSMTLCFLMLMQSCRTGEKEEEDSDHEDEEKHHTQEMKERRKKVEAKICAQPMPFKNIEQLKRYDACGPSLMFGQVTLRNCYTTILGFKKRLTIEMVYQMRCMFSDKYRQEFNKKLRKCLYAIAKITPKEEVVIFLDKLNKLKTPEEKKKFVGEFQELRLKCQEAAMGL